MSTQYDQMRREERIQFAAQRMAQGLPPEDAEAAQWVEETEIMESLFALFNGAYYTVNSIDAQLVRDARALIIGRRAAASSPPQKD